MWNWYLVSLIQNTCYHKPMVGSYIYLVISHAEQGIYLVGNLLLIDSDVEVIQAEKLNSSITARHLILMFGDIDQVGEKKQLAALKDINVYEKESMPGPCVC